MRRAAGRVAPGLPAAAELDRVDLHSVRQLVDRALQREGADRFAGRAHEGVGQHVHVGHLLLQPEAPGGIHVPGREGELLGHVVVRRHGDGAGMDQRVERAVARGAQRHPLHRRRAAADQAIDALAAQPPAAPAGPPASPRRRPGSGGSTGPCRRSRRRRTATARAPDRASARTPWRARPRCWRSSAWRRARSAYRRPSAPSRRAARSRCGSGTASHRSRRPDGRTRPAPSRHFRSRQGPARPAPSRDGAPWPAPRRNR